MKTHTRRNYFYGRLSVFLTMAFLCAAPCFAQGPFIAPLTAAEQLAITGSRIVAVIALVWGGTKMLLGDHRMEALIMVITGVGLMAYAQQVVTWLFP